MTCFKASMVRSWRRVLTRTPLQACFSSKQSYSPLCLHGYSTVAVADTSHKLVSQFRQTILGGSLLRDLRHPANAVQQKCEAKKFRSLLTGPQVRLAYSTISSVSGPATLDGSAVRILVAGGEKAQRQIAWWLYGCVGWVGSMVVLGGVTRLTRSGLSMTDWRFTGTLPPLSEEEWEREFNKYKASPEYQRINLGMPLADFKFIYWMEYAHRMWGRALGLVFLGPFAYFSARGYVTRPLAIRLGILGSLGAGQGFVGWWMVKSGLEAPASEHAEPRVSPYRLAAHLASAFVIYSGLLWTALSVAMPLPPMKTASHLTAAVKARRLVHPVAALVGFTAISGAFVAGNDAGRAYNTFPKMGDRWIPETILEMEPFYRNFFENTATVQFDHRVLATATLASVTSLWLSTSKLPLHPASVRLLQALLGMTALQVTLGVSTLLTYVPVSLGSAHQTGALALFSIILALMHTLRVPKGPSAAIGQQALHQAKHAYVHAVPK